MGTESVVLGYFAEPWIANDDRHEHFLGLEPPARLVQTFGNTRPIIPFVLLLLLIGVLCV